MAYRRFWQALDYGTTGKGQGAELPAGSQIESPDYFTFSADLTAPIDECDRSKCDENRIRTRPPLYPNLVKALPQRFYRLLDLVMPKWEDTKSNWMLWRI
ncbi:hypothetical protein [Microbulbifer sp. DLAB2-AA]|uniref:hypothetical protein n=1 Tax=Microbulbifer sp. DLAB2-AA TaxID=3243394 RepID=UPI00403A2F25